MVRAAPCPFPHFRSCRNTRVSLENPKTWRLRGDCPGTWASSRNQMPLDPGPQATSGSWAPRGKAPSLGLGRAGAAIPSGSPELCVLFWDSVSPFVNGFSSLRGTGERCGGGGGTLERPRAGGSRRACVNTEPVRSSPGHSPHLLGLGQGSPRMSVHYVGVVFPHTLQAKGPSRTGRQPRSGRKGTRGAEGPGPTSSQRCQDPGEGLPWQQ